MHEKKIATFDLDSTLADTGHRHALIDRVNGTDWDAYSKACINDAVILASKVLLEILNEAGYEVHFVTGRTIAAWDETVDWLVKNGFKFAGLWMDNTPDGDHFSVFGGHAEYKLARIREVEEHTGAKVRLHVDDWAEVKQVLEKHGIPCLCVRTPQEITALTGQLQELA